MGQMGTNLGNPSITGLQQDRAQWGDMDSSEKGASLLAGGIKGLAKGFSNYQQQNQAMRQGGGGPVQIPMAQQPNVQLPMGLPQQQRPIRGNNLSFYGDSGY